MAGLNARAAALGRPHRAVLVAGHPRHSVLDRVRERLQIPLVETRVVRTPSGILASEIIGKRGPLADAQAFVIGTTRPGSVDDDFLKNVAILQALSISSVRDIVLFLLHTPYGRQDRKAKTREPVSNALMHQFLASLTHWGAVGVIDDRLVGIGERAILSRTVILDRHSPQDGITMMPIESITGVRLLAEFFRQRPGQFPFENIWVTPTDAGGTRAARIFAQSLFQGFPGWESHLLSMLKVRVPNPVSRLYGEIPPGRVSQAIVIIFDDMVDTGGTIESAVHALEEKGVNPRQIWVATIHALYSGNALERFQALGLGGIVVTNSTQLEVARLPEGTLTVEVAPVVTAAIERSVLGVSFEGLEGIAYYV